MQPAKELIEVNRLFPGVLKVHRFQAANVTVFESVILVCDVAKRDKALELDIAFAIRLHFLWNKAVRVLPNRIELQIRNALRIWR